MIATWPKDLPPPERDSYQLVPMDVRRQRQADAAPPGYRRRYSNAAKTVTLSFLLTQSERLTFDHFFHQVCKEGAEYFWMPDPTKDGWPIVNDDGAELLVASGLPILMSALWLCAWGESIPTETIEGRDFRKSFDVVVMP